ncbi:hypothetical protein SUGI_1196780 [Cryptomeria japonica]|nr:hypothetical protein SUGI_1196780 [Cryptomeria japonica]
MTGEKREFIKLEDWNGGLVRFGDNSSIKIKGKGTLSIDGKLKEHDVYYVEGLKHNLLSVIQMCDKGYKFTFDSTGCQIKKDSTGQVVVEGKRIDGNVYNLKECYESQCMLRQVDEIWLWHQRLCHINFDNLVAKSRKGCVRNIPPIVKLVNTFCDECVKGKQTKVTLKTKEHNTSKPLEVVHTDLCGPTRTRALAGSFDSKSDEGIFVGYSSNNKAYKYYYKRLRRVIESVHVKVDEDIHKGCHPQVNRYDDSSDEDDES